MGRGMHRSARLGKGLRCRKAARRRSDVPAQARWDRQRRRGGGEDVSSSDEKMASAMAAHMQIEAGWLEYLHHRCGSPIERLFLMAVFRQPYTFRVEGYEAFALDRDGAHWFQQYPASA